MIYKCNNCGNIATWIYSILIDEVLPSFATPGERKIITLALVGFEPAAFG